MRMGACEFGTITAPQTTPKAVFVWGLGNLSCLSTSPSGEEQRIVSLAKRLYMSDPPDMISDHDLPHNPPSCKIVLSNARE
ncbi:hypothetical protein VNO80_08908 [Phaseolus coccineus]|uniref:Uncharacterized protein n=1 Tax=Phaseolus coccineus TaxID=3886 RepID=A0AAN9R909_PHACN